MKSSRNKVRFYIYAISLLPLILLLGTGIIMLDYHAGAPYESEIMGFDGHFWLLTHKVLTIIVIPFITLHLIIKTDWLKRFFSFSLKGKFKKSNSILFVIFLICSVTALVSWIISDNSQICSTLRGIHNKLGILLIVIFVLHFWNYRKQIIRQFKKLLLKDSVK